MKLSHFLLSLGAVAALSACNSKQENAASNAPLKITPVAPPKGGDWTQTVSMTPQGGFVMGNPNAKVKLIEIGALTCPHCREFDEKGVPTLVDMATIFPGNAGGRTPAGQIPRLITP